MLDLDLFLKVNRTLTEADKESCKSMIYKILELANIARREGVLVLEQKMLNEPNAFLKMGIELLTDGTDHDTLKQILLRAAFSGGTNAEIMLKLLITDGVLAIQKGALPRLIRALLGSLFGEQTVLDLEAGVMYDNYNEFLESIRSTRAIPESVEFDALLASMADITVQRVLREIDLWTLVIAMRGCGYAAINKFLVDNVSKRLSMQAASEWQVIKPTVEMILTCQKAILEIITMLEQSGEIIIRS